LSNSNLTAEKNQVNFRVLTLNGGSSSIKFALFEGRESSVRVFAGEIVGIGSHAPTFRVKGVPPTDPFPEANQGTDYASAIDLLADWIQARCPPGSLQAIGHRVVHGGPRFHMPTVINSEVIQALRTFIPFDPEHLPNEIQLVELFRRRFPEIPQVACFDTSFHHDLPRVAQIVPIPRRYEAQGVRRYGFHGLSYTFLRAELARIAGESAAQGRVIFAHLGSGASLAAVYQGKSVETSMGFTPASGIPMSTRSGDLDPGLFSFLASTEGRDAKNLDHLFSFESGLLGVSEISADMAELLKIQSADSRAAEAVELFCYQTKKCIGSFAAVLSGVDTLVFAGGIGENSSEIRRRICRSLEFLGIVLDEERNRSHQKIISAASSRVVVRIIPTDEESVIAQLVYETLKV
jgi:acetate kinase